MNNTQHINGAETMNAKMLNAVKDLLIKFANDNGIDLAKEFGDVANFKKFVIALTFKTLTDNGVETHKAYDLIFGDGQFDKLANDVWNAAQ